MGNQVELKWYQKPNGVIILLLFFFPVGLYLMWKNELWTKQKRWIITGALALIVITNINNKNSSSDSSSNSSSNISSKSEETSKEVYRKGYYDGQTGSNFPSNAVSAYEFYISRGYNFSSADYNVYEMGYNDGLYGRSKEY